MAAKRPREDNSDSKREIRPATGHNLEAIAKALRAKPDFTIETMDGKVEVSKIVLMAMSRVFNQLPEAKSDIKLDFQSSTVNIVLDWMHNSQPFQCVSYSIKEIFQVLRFATQYEIKNLENEINDYYLKTVPVKSYWAIARSILDTYEHDGIGKNIYDYAINTVIALRIFISKIPNLCCGTPITKIGCCDGKTQPCPRDSEFCCKHRSPEDLAKKKSDMIKHGEWYATIFKDLPIRVHNDILKREIEYFITRV